MGDDLKGFLDEKVAEYNQPSFITLDPISIPDLFRGSKKGDIEISALFAATLAWGQRPTIIKKCKYLMSLMDNQPLDFIVNHQDQDLKPFEDFKHRTFNGTDTLYFIHWLKWYYSNHNHLRTPLFLPVDSLRMDCLSFMNCSFHYLKDQFAPENMYHLRIKNQLVSGLTCFLDGW